MKAPVSTRYIVTGTIHTMDEAAPHAEAFAVIDGTIAAVGTLSEVLASVGDLPVLHHDSVVLPGLTDAHNHHALAGDEELFQLGFPQTSTLPEVLAQVSAYARDLEDGEWVVGGVWGSHLLEQISTAEALVALDEASWGHPVLLSDDSHHNKWANTRAMELSGISTMVTDPPGGTILRDSSGAPTGVLNEGAAAVVEQHRLSTLLRTAEFHAQCSERGIERLSEHGIVAFQDAAASLGMIQGLAALESEGRLNAWVVSSLLINDHIFGNSVVGKELMAVAGEYATEHHRPNWTKIFLDGVPSSHNAAFLEPYRGDDEHGHAHYGTTLMDPSELEGWLREAARHDMGVKVHCTGNAAVRQVLDAVEAVRADGLSTPVHIAHGSFVAPVDRPRFASLGVVAEISPFLWFPGVISGALADVLDDEVFDDIHPNRTLLDLGTHVAVGSDWPVSESPNPWIGVAGLVTRRDPTGRFPGVLNAAEAITRDEAVACVTSRGADAMGLGDVTGRLRVGNSADFVLLSQDPFTVPEQEIAATRAVATFFAGKLVHGPELVPGRARQE